MNTPQRISALLLLTAAGASPALWADYTAGQTLNISVPPTGLIAIGHAAGGPPSINIAAPTVAGKSFAGIRPVVTNPTFPIAITSNVSDAQLWAKADVAGHPLSNYKLGLTLTSAGTGFDAAATPLYDDMSNNMITNVGNMATGVLPNTGGHNLTLSANSSATMMPYGTYTVTITYTLMGTGI